MTEEAWQNAFARCLGVSLFGDSIDINEHGEEITGDTILLAFNADHTQTIPFVMPAAEDSRPWLLLLDTGNPQAELLKLGAAEFDGNSHGPFGRGGGMRAGQRASSRSPAAARGDTASRSRSSVRGSCAPAIASARMLRQ